MSSTKQINTKVGFIYSKNDEFVYQLTEYKKKNAATENCAMESISGQIVTSYSGYGCWIILSLTCTEGYIISYACYVATVEEISNLGYYWIYYPCLQRRQK